MRVKTPLRLSLCSSSLILTGLLFSAFFGCSRSTSNELTPAFEELGKKFEQATGIKVVFSFGSTGTLAQQIENGAPMDVFAAANVEYIDKLEQKGLIIPGTKALYARGRITIWTNADSKLQIDRLEDFTRPEVQRVAIANPDHAPYGVAAREALQSAGIWDSVKPKLVFGENVRQALQYAETGNVEVAIVALSLSIKSKGRWTLVPQEMHTPLDQALAVIKGSKNEEGARRFASFINGAEGRPTMRQYGFVLPGEEPIQ
jgi:molybdate transport system substrate-binding protein